MAIINKDLRKIIVDLVVRGKGGHIPSAFSIVDIINTLYEKVLRVYPNEPESKKRDYFVLSKGHGCAALYSVLFKHGFLSKKDLEEYNSFDGILGGHPDRTRVPGAEASTGSLGHGLPFSVGIALGLKISKANNKVITLVGDGECHEGTVWESALVAQNLNLTNLCCIVDFNGSAEQILPHPSIKAQWESFGWDVIEIDGHNPEEIENALIDYSKNKNKKPIAIIANTIKGQGVKMMQTHGPWHYKIPDEIEYKTIMKELD